MPNCCKNNIENKLSQQKQSSKESVLLKLCHGLYGKVGLLNGSTWSWSLKMCLVLLLLKLIKIISFQIMRFGYRPLELQINSCSPTNLEIQVQSSSSKGFCRSLENIFRIWQKHFSLSQYVIKQYLFWAHGEIFNFQFMYLFFHISKTYTPQTLYIFIILNS